MSNTDFDHRATDALESLSSTIEEKDEKGILDVDFMDGILTIVTPDTPEYVINKHAPTQKIWASSPKSGAHYFAYDAPKESWVSTKGDILDDLIIEELNHYTDQ